MNDKQWKKYLKFDEIKKTEHGMNTQERLYDIQMLSRFIAFKDTKILDVGCENGSILAHMKDKYNCDISGCTLGGEDKPDFVKEGDMHELPFDDNSFDIVFIFHTLEHSISPYIVLKEINRVLKNKGLVCIIMPEEGDVYTSCRQHYSTMTFRQLFNLLGKTGFSMLTSLRKEYMINLSETKRDIFCIARKVVNKESLIDDKIIAIPSLGEEIINDKGCRYFSVLHHYLKDGTFNHFLGRTDSLK